MASNLPPRRNVGARPYIIASLVALAVIALGLALISRAAPQAAPHFVDLPQPNRPAVASTRTLVIAAAGETLPRMSSATGPLMSNLVRGALPSGVAQATVRSDENCAPDADSISHCLNELDLGSARVVVQHHHNMSAVPCLTPGEVVNIETLAQYQASS